MGRDRLGLGSSLKMIGTTNQSTLQEIRFFPRLEQYRHIHSRRFTIQIQSSHLLLLLHRLLHRLLAPIPPVLGTLNVTFPSDQIPCPILTRILKACPIRQETAPVILGPHSISPITCPPILTDKLRHDSHARSKALQHTTIPTPRPGLHLLTVVLRASQIRTKLSVGSSSNQIS